MNKSKKSPKKTIVVMSIFLIVIVISYYFIRTSTKPLIKIGTDNTTEYDKLMAKDIENNYPSSPREVVKLYNRIMQCLYNQNLKDEEINKLAEVLRALLDEELLNNNPEDTFLIELKSEITTYRKASRTIINYIVQSNKDVSYWEKNKESLSSVVSSISLKEKSDYTKVYHEYILRQDNDDKWKILGWKPTKEINLNENKK